jgi:hypothetical protein
MLDYDFNKFFSPGIFNKKYIYIKLIIGRKEKKKKNMSKQFLIVVKTSFLILNT